MKRLFITVITLYAQTSIAQAIYSDANFLKLTNHLWNTCYLLKSLDANRITHQGDIEKERQTDIDILRKDAAITRRYYESIKAKYPNEKAQLTQIKQWIDMTAKLPELLEGDSWQIEPTWALGKELLRMDLQDVTNKKLK